MKKSIQSLTLSSLLMSIAIIVPMISPIKILIEPASFTLGSHIAIIIAMMISPSIALSVEIGATIGFFLAGFPITVVLRALSQIIFVYIGAIIIKNKPNLFHSNIKTMIFILLTGLIHASAEVLISLPLYTADSIIYHIFILVGIGTLIHHSVDFILSLIIYKILLKSKTLQSLSNIKSL